MSSDNKPKASCATANPLQPWSAAARGQRSAMQASLPDLQCGAAQRCRSGLGASTSYRVDAYPLPRSHRGLAGSFDPHSRHRRLVACRADKDKDKEPKKPGADFSAYWSLKVRNFFSARRNYLEEADVTQRQRPKVLDWFDEEIGRRKAELAKQEAEIAKTAEDPDVQYERLEREATERTRKIMAPLEVKLLGEELPQSPPTEEQLIRGRVRRALVPSWQDGVSLAFMRSKAFLQAVLMAPWTLLVGAYRAWQGLFTTQRYEWFLMSEGEKLWYWRNRMENERWFWEVFLWDRVLFPVLCTVLYEYIAPSHLVWVVVVPVVFLMWQYGRIIGPGDLEFWLIAYFGVWQKCRGDLFALISALCVWA